jgi:hypothetical protein
MTVDFMTELSVAECRAWLAHAASQTDRQIVEIWDDDSFTIRCCADQGDPYIARFWGTLEARKGGTWVWGTTLEDAEARRPFNFRPTLVVVVLMGLAAEAFVRDARNTMMLWLVVLVALGALWVGLWIERHWHALRVVAWVWETLWVPLPKDGDRIDQAAPDEPGT